jgi:exodeoxyribonuclease VII small subunit
VTTKEQKPSILEKELQQLEKIVATLESTDLPLEKALIQFEHGVNCVKKCQELLRNAEQRIEILTRETSSD